MAQLHPKVFNENGIEMSHFILSETWFILHGVIRHFGIKPWEKIILENGTQILKPTRQLYFWLRFTLIFISFNIFNMVVYIIGFSIYEISFDDIKNVIWHLNDSYLDIVTAFTGQFTITFLFYSFMRNFFVLTNGLVKAQEDFKDFAIHDFQMMKNYKRKMFINMTG